MNIASLIGRLTKEPELKYTPNGKAVVQFTIAVNRPYTKDNGEKEADFINCVAWNKTAETICNYSRKGHQVGVTGPIRTRSYENQEGRKIYITEIIVENLTLLEKRTSERPLPEEPPETKSKQQEQFNPYSNYSTNQSTQNTRPSAYSTDGTINIPDDDLPF